MPTPTTDTLAALARAWLEAVGDELTATRAALLDLWEEAGECPLEIEVQTAHAGTWYCAAAPGMGWEYATNPVDARADAEAALRRALRRGS